MGSFLQFLLVISLITFPSSSTNVYTGTANIIGSNSLTITIDYDANTVVLILMGSPNVWYGFGFGNTLMEDTYAIIMEYVHNDLSQGTVSEFTLGNHRAGSVYINEEITLLSDVTDGQIRSVTVIRPIIGVYTFPNPPSLSSIAFVINIISAIGSIPYDYATDRSAAHLSTNMAATSITLRTVANALPTNIPTLSPIQNAIPTKLVTTTQNPTKNPITSTTNPTKAAITTTINPSATNDIECASNACMSQNIECLLTDVPCSVQCLSTKSCYESTIGCNSNSDCSIEGLNDNALTLANVVGPIGQSLNILCNNVFSCDHIKIYGEYSSRVDMVCDGIKSCQDFEIFCPVHSEQMNADGTYEKHCVIMGNIRDPLVDGFSVQTSMVIHAVNGWDDIDLTQYNPLISGNSHSNIMVCGSVPLDSCNITHSNGVWNCLETHSNCYKPSPTTQEPITTTKGCVVSEGSINAGSLDVTAIINCMENTITFDIAYREYANNWFGLVFNTEMFGDALIFTTGKNNDRSASAYAYYLNGKTLSDIVYKSETQWTQIQMVLDIFSGNGLRIVYQIDLDHTIWDKYTNVIHFNEAIGSSLRLQKHITRTTNTFSIDLLPQTTTTTPTTKQPTLAPITNEPTVMPTPSPTMKPTTEPTVSPTQRPTNNPVTTTKNPTIARIVTTAQPTTMNPTTILPTVKPTLKPTENSIDLCTNTLLSTVNTGNDNNELIVTSILNCVDNTIAMDITFNNHNNNWFGLVFNTEMSGKALVYTSGLRGDQLEQLYSYEILSRKPSDIIYNRNENWVEILTELSATAIHIVYEQDLDQTEWDQNTKQIIFRYATGTPSNMRLQYHQFRSEQVFTLDFVETIPTVMPTNRPIISTTKISNNKPTTLTSTTTMMPKTSTTTMTTTSYDTTIVCDQHSQCADTVVQCTPDTLNRNNTCVINCVSELSCFNSVFQCMEGYDCHLHCIGYESCKQSRLECGDYSNCFINGVGDKSLYEMSVSGQLYSLIHHSLLQIVCNGYESCYKSLIYGRWSDKLEIICGDEQSCDGMKIQCPPFTQEKNCKILVTDTAQYSIANSIDIFAINSWNDIDIISANDNSVLYGTIMHMFCNETYADQCLMEINDQTANQWNCNEPSSKCYIEMDTYANDNHTIVSVPNVTIIRCTDDRECQNKTISCDDNNNDTCRIICDGPQSCMGSDIVCPLNNNKCEIMVSECTNVSSIQCGTSEECNIECFGSQSCATQIECGNNNNNNGIEECVCNINGMETESLIGSDINCLNNSVCNINCAAYDTCNDITIHGKDANVVDVLCVNHSCNNMALFCPSNQGYSNNKCIISGKGDVHTEFIIYAENSWNDIDLRNYDCVINNQTSKMFCGKEFNNVCAIGMDSEHAWNCIDPDSVCYSGTEQMSSTMNMNEIVENVSLSNGEWTQSELIAVIVICCMVVGIVCILALYCWCYKPNRMDKKYKSVECNNNKEQKRKRKHKQRKHKKQKKKKPLHEDCDKKNAIIEFQANMEQMNKFNDE